MKEEVDDAIARAFKFCKESFDRLQLPLCICHFAHSFLMNDHDSHEGKQMWFGRKAPA